MRTLLLLAMLLALPAQAAVTPANQAPPLPVLAEIAPPAHVLVAPAPHGEAKDVYLPAGALSPELLPSPPAEGSKAHKKQLAQVRAAQKNVSADAMTGLLNEDVESSETLIAVIGEGFTATAYPKTFALLQKTEDTGVAATKKAKKFWQARRPHLVDKKIKLLLPPKDRGGSYPSGHTSVNHLLAEVLGLLFPEKRGVLRERASEIAWHRVQAGVHYPVDLEGGRTLAAIMLGSLLNDEEFQNDLSAAAAEVAAPVR
ncbi:MAG: phosphatase PAP2 family protein [Bdellovibrionales bacterium]